MTARRLALAWSAGATVGLLVGFLIGESVRDGLDLARLRRPEPREGAGTGTSATPTLIGRETGAQRLIPAQREPCQQRSPGGGLVCCRTGNHSSHLFPGTTQCTRDEGV